MATITKSIGTSSRDYSTITSWEADLDNGAIYASGDMAVGECYDDSAFDESVTINGGGTVGLAKTTLTVASGQRHDGTAGTGARIKASSTLRSITLATDSIPRDILWLELDGNGLTFSGANFRMITMGAVSSATQNLATMLVHSMSVNQDGSTNAGIIADGFAYDPRILNCIVYDLSSLNTGFAGEMTAIRAGGTQALNCTVHDITGLAGVAYGVRYATTKNTVATDCTDASFVGTTDTYCASSDSTATGTGAITSIVAADTYVSTTGGSEDLHLKSGASCIDAGTDLVTTPTGVNIDINGRDRDSNGDTWDIGAHEFVGAAPVGMMLRRRASIRTLLRR